MKKLRLLRLSPSANISTIWQKYATLNVYQENDYIQNLSEFHIRIVPGGNFNGMVKLSENFLLTEIFSFLVFGRCIRLLIKSLFYIKKYRINMVHSNDPFFYGFIMLLAAKLSKVPFCVSIHADYKKSNELEKDPIVPKIFYSDKISYLCQKLVFKYADRIFPIRESMIHDIMNNGNYASKIRVFPHGMNLIGFKEKSKYNIHEIFNIPENSLIVSSVGRIMRENYCYDLLTIAEKVTNIDQNVFFIICGDGKEYLNIKDLKKNCKYPDNIILPGFVSNEIIIDIRRQSYLNLCLMAGFSLIEAAASGRPTISYDVEWHYELIKNNVTGFLVKEFDVNEVVNKIIYLFKNPDISNQLGNNAKVLAFMNHDITYVHQIKKKLYTEIMESQNILNNHSESEKK